MLEIIALFFLCSKNGRLAASKGLPARRWITYTVLAWIGAEFTGMLFAMALYGKTAILSILTTGLFCGFGGYLLIRRILENKPDSKDEKVSTSVHVDDLRPPKK